MKRLFLYAAVNAALNASLAGCAAIPGGTLDYSTALKDTSSIAETADSIARLLAAPNSAPIPAASPMVVVPAP